jgi:hypothetical protein
MAQGINNFMQRYHRAVANRSSELKLNLQEANDLAKDINTILGKLADVQSSANPPISGTIVVDGGKFTD